MERHRFDPLSFVFGVLFVAVAVLGLVGTRVLDLRDLAWMAPALLVIAGGALLLSSTRRPAADGTGSEPDHDRPTTPPAPAGMRSEDPSASDAPTVPGDDDDR